MITSGKVVGEIIDISFTQITCEAKDLENIPTPGQFIRFALDDYIVLGCTTRYDIGNISQEGYPRALWKSPDDLEKFYPQLQHILKGYFKCVILGFISNGKFISCLPDRSIRLHTMVELAEKKDILLATQNSLFLNSIIKAKDVDIIEVIPWMLYFIYCKRKRL